MNGINAAFNSTDFLDQAYVSIYTDMHIQSLWKVMSTFGLFIQMHTEIYNVFITLFTCS